MPAIERPVTFNRGRLGGATESRVRATAPQRTGARRFSRARVGSCRQKPDRTGAKQEPSEAADAVYEALKRVYRLPAVLGASLTLQMESSQASLIEGGSGGLSMALVQFVVCAEIDRSGRERVISRGYHYPGANFGAVAATGTIDREGRVGCVQYIEAKVRGYLQALAAGDEAPCPFIVFYPRINQDQISLALQEEVAKAGGQLVAVDTLAEALETLQVSIPESEAIGLKAYTRQDRCQFMGRNQAQSEIRQSLQALWQAHCDDKGVSRPPMLYWLQGKSGCGKLSLLQAA